MYINIYWLLGFIGPVPPPLWIRSIKFNNNVIIDYKESKLIFLKFIKNKYETKKLVFSYKNFRINFNLIFYSYYL